MTSLTRLLLLPNELIINVLKYLTISELYQLNYLLNDYFKDIIKLMSNNIYYSLFEKRNYYRINISKSLDIDYAILLNEDNQVILDWIDTLNNKPTTYTNNIKEKMFIGAKHGFIDVYIKYDTFLDSTNYLEGYELFDFATKSNNFEIIFDVYNKIRFYDNNEEFGPFHIIIENGIHNLIDNNSHIIIGFLVNLLFEDNYEGYMFTTMSYALKHNKSDIIFHLIRYYYNDNEPGLSFDIQIILSDISELMDVSDALNVFLTEINNTDIEISPEQLNDCIINSLIYGRFNTFMVLLNNGALINNKCISAAFIGSNMECIKYIINNYEINEKHFNEIICLSCSVGTKQTTEYLINNFPQYIDNKIINQILYFALGYANKECIIFAKELGATEFKEALDVANKIIKRRYDIIKGNDLYYDFSDYSIKLYNFSENFNSEYNECKQLVHSWIN